jgi:hypothetical protein
MCRWRSTWRRAASTAGAGVRRWAAGIGSTIRSRGTSGLVPVVVSFIDSFVRGFRRRALGDQGAAVSSGISGWPLRATGTAPITPSNRLSPVGAPCRRTKSPIRLAAAAVGATRSRLSVSAAALWTKPAQPWHGPASASWASWRSSVRACSAIGQNERGNVERRSHGPAAGNAGGASGHRPPVVADW